MTSERFTQDEGFGHHPYEIAMVSGKHYNGMQLRNRPSTGVDPEVQAFLAEQQAIFRELIDITEYGVKYPKSTIRELTRSEEYTYPTPDFSYLAKNRERDIIPLNLDYRYDIGEGIVILYPMGIFSSRWKDRTKAIYHRLMGLSPKQIALKMNISHNTVKSYLKLIKQQPMISVYGIRGKTTIELKEEGFQNLIRERDQINKALKLAFKFIGFIRDLHQNCPVVTKKELSGIPNEISVWILKLQRRVKKLDKTIRIQRRQQ